MKKINIPGSKSISNRVLFLAALADKKMDLVGVLESDDTRYLRECLGNFGVEFEKRGDVITVIPPEELSNEGRDKENFIGNAGTAARFLTAFSLFFKGEYVLKGIPRMHERPFEDLFMALKDLGVGIESEKEGFLPATFMGKERLDKNKVSISGKISSQFISGLLLVSPRVVGGLEIDIIDEIPSRPYVEMTVDILRIWGVEVEVSEDFKNFKVQEGITAPDSFHVPADCSSASYPVAFSLLKKEEVEISNFGEKTFQGDEKFLEVAEKMGAKIEKNGDKVQIFPPQKLKALGEISFEEMPDVSMTGMILAAFADGESEFHGLESLRVKECDRIEAMRLGLEQIGAQISVEGDVVRIVGNSDFKVNAGDYEIDSFDDHRIAFCFGLLQVIFEAKFKIKDPECVTKTWPNFWLDLADLNNNLRLVSAVIVRKEDKYLIVRKPRKDHAWQFPQGGVDEGETGLQAAERELNEECGKDLKIELNKEVIGDYEYFFPKDFKRHKKNIVGVRVELFGAEYVSGKVEVDGEEIVEHKWVSKDELGDYFEKGYFESVMGAVAMINEE